MIEYNAIVKESGVKLVAFLSKLLQGKYSARQLKQAIEQNRCRVNDRIERFASFNLGVGDRVSLDLAGFQSKAHSTFSIEKDRILFEDEDLLAYNKPSGVPCDADEMHRLTGFELLHRLDRETTGVLLLGKNQASAKAMLEQFKQRLVEKTYVAIVDGVMASKTGTIENALEKKRIYQGQTIWGEAERGKGLYAYTNWKVVGVGKDASLVQCFPKTGRTHQLRVHLAGLGHPILGDFQYGKLFKCLYRPDRILLHALEVRFMHPGTQQQMHISAPMPDDFTDSMRKLGLGR